MLEELKKHKYKMYMTDDEVDIDVMIYDALAVCAHLYGGDKLVKEIEDEAARMVQKFIDGFCEKIKIDNKQ